MPLVKQLFWPKLIAGSSSALVRFCPSDLEGLAAIGVVATPSVEQLSVAQCYTREATLLWSITDLRILRVPMPRR